MISIMNCLFQLGFEWPHKGCKVLWSFKSFRYWVVFFSWIWMSPQIMFVSVIFEIISILNCLFQLNLNVPTKNVRFCQLEFECPHKECKILSSLKWFEYWTVFFIRDSNAFTNNVKYCDLWNQFNTELHFSIGIWMSPHRIGCKVLSCLKSFGYWTVF